MTAPDETSVRIHVRFDYEETGLFIDGIFWKRVIIGIGTKIFKIPIGAPGFPRLIFQRNFHESFRFDLIDVEK